jgi:patatin-like phospholipase/acyl hydrolase
MIFFLKHVARASFLETTIFALNPQTKQPVGRLHSFIDGGIAANNLTLVAAIKSYFLPLP